MANDYTYTVVIEADEDGGFVATVPALPGCVSQGESLEETKANIREAMALYLDVAKEHGDPIPADTSVILETIKLAG